jgi:hypothetical protein
MRRRVSELQAQAVNAPRPPWDRRRGRHPSIPRLPAARTAPEQSDGRHRDPR